MNHSTIKAELIDLADSICRMAKIEPLQIIYNGMTSANGRANFKIRNVKLANTIFNENEEYCYAVVVHEVCHHIHYEEWKASDRFQRPKYAGHGHRFKEIETKWLANYGMRPIYKRAYWKRLLDMEGNVLWTTWKERRSIDEVVDDALYEAASEEDIAFIRGLFHLNRRT